MCLASKTGLPRMAFTLLTIGMLVQGLPLSAAEHGSTQEEVATVHQNEIKKVQESLRNEGHYRGKVDGVLGLRTRASIRAYQKAQKLPVTGQLDTRTAGKLGVRPDGRKETGNHAMKGKPSAGKEWAKGSGRTSKRLSKTAVAPTNSGDGVKTFQTKDDNVPQ